MQPAYSIYDRKRRVGKRRRFVVAGFALLAASAIGWSVFMATTKTAPTQTSAALSHKAQPAPTPSTPPRLKDAQLAWPVVGQAAVGSVQDGVLTRSADTEEVRPTASMAKVITALAIMEKQPLKPGHTGVIYTLTPRDEALYQEYAAINGVALPVRAGTELTQYHALQAMLIPSANNIADMLAEKTFGSTQAYTSYVADMLKRMGVRQTVVTDPSGFSMDTVSTPSDLVKIGVAALKNPVIAEIVSQPQAEIPGIGLVKNTNALLGDVGVIGIKTGTTNAAGSCLLFAVQQNDAHGKQNTVVAVIMGSSNAGALFEDSRTLLVSIRDRLGADAKPVQ